MDFGPLGAGGPYLGARISTSFGSISGEGVAIDQTKKTEIRPKSFGTISRPKIIRLKSGLKNSDSARRAESIPHVFSFQISQNREFLGYSVQKQASPALRGQGLR